MGGWWPWRGALDFCGRRGHPYIIVDEGGDEAPKEGSAAPGPQGGEKSSGGEPEAPVGPKAPTEPRPNTRAKAEAWAGTPKAEAIVGATATPRAAAGAHPAAPGSQGAPSY